MTEASMLRLVKVEKLPVIEEGTEKNMGDNCHSCSLSGWGPGVW